MNLLRQVTSDPNDRVTAIRPEPAEPVRAAIERGLADTAAADVRPGWAAAALVEGVGADEDGSAAVSGPAADPLQHHDVCSLW